MFSCDKINSCILNNRLHLVVTKQTVLLFITGYVCYKTNSLTLNNRSRLLVTTQTAKLGITGYI